MKPTDTAKKLHHSITILAMCCVVAPGLLLVNAHAAAPQTANPADQRQIITVSDNERMCDWLPAAPEEKRTAGFANFSVSRVASDGAHGSYSCKWTVQKTAGGTTAAQIAAKNTPRQPFDRLTMLVRQLQPDTARIQSVIADADGATYHSPPVSISREDNWQSVTFDLSEFAIAGGETDPNPGIDFPVKSLILALKKLRPHARYELCIDHLRIRPTPDARLQVIELAGQKQVKTGNTMLVRFRLRSKSQFSHDLQLTVHLSQGGRDGCAVTTGVDVPPEGLQSGDLLPVTKLALPIPQYLKPGEYTLNVTAQTAIIHIPDRKLLPASVVRVNRQASSRPTFSVDTTMDVPRAMVGDEAVHTCFSLPDVSAENAIGRLRQTRPDMVRFAANIGRSTSGAVHIPWSGHRQLGFSELDDAIVRILSAAPNTTIFLTLRITPPDWWLDAHRSQLVLVTSDDEGYTRLRHPSYSSQAWRDAMTRALRATITHIEKGPAGDCIGAYEVAGGRSGRWMAWLRTASGWGDYSQPANNGLRNWLQDKYDSLVDLRTAYGQPARPAVDRPDAVTGITKWGQIEVPAVRRRSEIDTWLLEPFNLQPVIDHRLFTGTEIVATIKQLCNVVRQATNGRKLCGVPYGHLSGATADDNIPPPLTGHLSLPSVLELSEIDFLVAPLSYGSRQAFSMPVGSVMRADKMVIGNLPIERTDPFAAIARAVGREPWLSAPSADVDIDTPQLTKRLHSSSDAEVAAIIDPDSTAFMAADSPMTKLILRRQIRQLKHIGAPVDIWLLQDFLARRVPQYRMYVFVNAFHVDPTLLSQALTATLNEGDVVVWQSAPGILGQAFGGRAINRITGITTSISLSKRPLTATVSPENLFENGEIEESITYGCRTAVAPRPEIFDHRVEVAGTGEGGDPALVLRETSTATVAYSTAPAMPPAVLRALARRANVHLYTDRPCYVRANDHLLAINPTDTGSITVRLPHAADVHNLRTGRQMAITKNEFTIPSRDGTWQVFELD